MRTFLKVFGVIVLLLVVLHFALEPVALHYANKALSNLKGYRGEIKDVDIHLYRGAYRIDSLNIVKVSDSQEETEFVSVGAIDISVQWEALFDGSIVGEIILEDPDLNFIVVGDTVQAGGDNDWVQTVQDLIPLQINRFEIINGEVKYIDRTASPPVDVGLYSIHALATNLGNVNESNELLPSNVSLEARTSGNGNLNVDMGINVLKKSPDFDLSMQLEQLELTYLKDFTEAYAGFTFKEGQMALSSEVAMKDGEYEGYVKPLLKNVRVIDLDNEQAGFWRKAWEVVVGGVMELFENQRKDQFATKVPFSGTTKDSEVGIIPTIGNVLRNAFIQAFDADVEQTVNIKDVEEKEEEDRGLFDFLNSDSEDSKE